MAGTRKEPGPTARRVAAALRRIRHGERDITTAEMSRRLSAIGYPIADTGITKAEKLDRRVDVDDLVPLALALGVTPNTLLLPQVLYLGSPDTYQLTPEVGGSAEEVWQWAQGERPILVPVDGATGWLGGERPLLNFSIKARPYLTAPRAPAAGGDGQRKPDPALRDLSSAVLKAMADGATAPEVRRVVELTIALPAILTNDELRERHRQAREG